MIPAEAVEAAARAAYEVMPVELFGEDNPVTWDQLSVSILGQARKDHELRRAKQALEAAAPHIRAQAFDEAASTLRNDMEVPQRIWVSRKVTALAMIERGDG